MSTIGDGLSSLVPAGYTERPAYGRVPDPITLFDAALLIARDPASRGRSHAEVFAGLVGAFWRNELTRRRRSLVFTLEPPRTRVRSEPGQTIAASPPPGTWLDRHGRVYDRDGISQARRRTRWTRREVLETLIRSKNLPNSYSPPLAVDADDGFDARTEGDRPDIPRTVSDWTSAERKAAYRILAETPLQDWSEYIRALIWDRLCITLRHLAFWIAARGECRPGFLVHVDTAPKPAQPAKKTAPPAPMNRQSAIDVEAECEEWLVGLMAGPCSARKKEYLAQARKNLPGLIPAEFDRAWSAAAKKTGSNWTRPGRRRAADSAGRPISEPALPNIVTIIKAENALLTVEERTKSAVTGRKAAISPICGSASPSGLRGLALSGGGKMADSLGQRPRKKPEEINRASN